jgi:hypothetical protein
MKWFTSANISRWFFVAKNRQGKVIIIQSHMDECYRERPVIGPFFSVEEAKKMKARWA